MTKEADLTVRSDTDYRRNVGMMQATERRVRTQARDEKWSADRLNETLVDTLFPYYRANTDPASPAASQGARNDFLKELGDDAAILDRQEHPKLYDSLDQQTRALNAVHGVNYAAPPIIIVDGLYNANNTPMQFDHDAILIDKEFFDSHQNNSTLSAGIAHELAHRYQRDDMIVRARLKANELHIDPSEAEIVHARSMETEADFDARRVSAPGALSSFLKDALRPNAVTLGHYMASDPRLTTENAIESWNGLTAAKQEELKTQAAALPAAVRNDYFTRGVQAIDASGADSYHPKVQARLDLQAALDKNPAVLTCRNVQFDGDTHIVEATSCGPRNVPLVVDGVPTGNRVRQ